MFFKFCTFLLLSLNIVGSDSQNNRALFGKGAYFKLLQGKFWAPSLYQEVPCVHGVVQTVTLVAGRAWRFYSPYFPSPHYPPETDCTWRFRLPVVNDISHVEITCDHFDVSGNFFDDCNDGDFLQIIDGDDGVEGNIKEKLCGDLTSWIPISAIITQVEGKSRVTNYIRNITVKFQSDQSVEGTGFSCRITGHKKNVTTSQATTSHPSHPIMTTPTSTSTTLAPLVCPVSDPEFCKCGRVKSDGFGDILEGAETQSDVRRHIKRVKSDGSMTQDFWNDSVRSTRPLRIVGGSATRPNQYPWQIGLTFKGRLFCGGSYVTKRHVITAAHCTDALRKINYTRSDFKIQFAEHDLATERDCAFSMTVNRIFQHALFNSRTAFDYDFSVLELDEEVDCSNFVSPICLPDDSATEATFDNRIAAVTGWGTLNASTGVRPVVLQHVFLQTMSNEQCQKTSSYSPEEITDTMLCAGEEGLDACQGDSGGPLAILENQKYVLAGITSWGEGCGFRGFPGVFSRVTSVLPWIKKILGPDLKDCLPK